LRFQLFWVGRNVEINLSDTSNLHANKLRCFNTKYLHRHHSSDNTFFNANNNQWSNYGKNNSWDDSLPSRSFSTDPETNYSTSGNIKTKSLVRPKSTVIDVKPFTILSEASFPKNGKNSCGNHIEQNAPSTALNEVVPSPVIIRDTITTGSNHR
jgi:hypothetical protein